MTTTDYTATHSGLELEVACGSAGCASVAARGELDSFTGGALRQTLGELIASGRTTISLDLSGLTFMDSAGHRSIGTAADLAERLGGEVRLDGCSVPVRRFLALSADFFAAPTRVGAVPDGYANQVVRPIRAVGF